MILQVVDFVEVPEPEDAFSTGKSWFKYELSNGVIWQFVASTEEEAHRKCNDALSKYNSRHGVKAKKRPFVISGSRQNRSS